MNLQEALKLFASGSDHHRHGRIEAALKDLTRAVEIASPIVEEFQKRQFDLMSAQRVNAAMAVVAESKTARQLLTQARDLRLQAHRARHGGPPEHAATPKQILTFRAKLKRAFQRLKKVKILGVANVREAPSSAGYETSELARKQGAEAYVYWHERTSAGSATDGSSTSVMGRSSRAAAASRSGRPSRSPSARRALRWSGSTMTA